MANTKTAKATHQILRPFTAEGIVREPGELIDASTWRTLKSLTAMRYVAALPASGLGGIYTCNCDRLWASKASAHTLCAGPDQKEH